MATIKEVAELSGVSKSTVSRFIANNGYVSQEAAKKIERVIKELNFVPNLQARLLKTKRSQLVGLMLPDISNPFFPRLAKGVEEFFQERGYQVILGNVGTDEQLEEKFLNVMIQSNVAGIISTHDFSKSHPDLTIPVVTVDRANYQSEYSVISDNQSGGAIAAEQVLAAGGKKIALVSGPLGPSNINVRYHSALELLQSAKNKVEIYEASSSSYEFDQVHLEAKAVLAKYPDLDSVIAPSDIHAIAFIHEILAAGKNIPEDIQVIGYDDILISQLIYPPLSTIHQSAYRMGLEAAKMIYKIAQGEQIKEKKIKLPVRYIERETLRK